MHCHQRTPGAEAVKDAGGTGVSTCAAGVPATSLEDLLNFTVNIKVL